MLGSFGEVYLLDWGIAKLAGEKEDLEVGPVSDAIVVGENATPETAAGSLLGPLAYMAPEQMIGEPASVRSDVFALGAILFEILAGQPLRDEDATFVRMLKGKLDARCSVRAPDRHVAPELEAICVRATAAKPEDRFASALALSEAVEKYLEGDRDVLRRREQAAEHVSRARAALKREPASTGAMRELGAALALDPENLEARAMVVEALTTVPHELPPEVREDLHRRTQESIAGGARMWPVMLVTWTAFVPLLYWAGIKEIAVMACGLGLMGLATILGVVRARRSSGRWLEYGSITASALAMVTVGRGFGPFVLVPTLLATFATAIQLHPQARTRLVALGVCVLALVGAVLLELSGVLPPIHGATASALLMSGSRTAGELPLTLLVLLMNVTAMISTALTVAGVRAKLTSADERLLVHAWQVRGMMPTGVGERSSERRLVTSVR